MDAENTGIPPLILQPFVENAIKHGLLHKKGEKRLFIHFDLVDAALKITIEDNGIGRKHAQVIKQRQQVVNTSFSTQATEKRVQIMNSFQKQNMQFEILDLIENEEALGTRVVILIPMR